MILRPERLKKSQDETIILPRDKDLSNISETHALSLL